MLKVSKKCPKTGHSGIQFLDISGFLMSGFRRFTLLYLEQVQGGAMDQVSKKSIKVLVVGNPANTNAVICSHYAPSIPKKNFSAMTRLDHNRATSQVLL